MDVGGRCLSIPIDLIDLKTTLPAAGGGFPVNRSAIAAAAGPLTRMTATPPRPDAVAIAAMVSPLLSPAIYLTFRKNFRISSAVLQTTRRR